jgi:Asp-tRNA(Asn)/Glu-tRNA(Gln) amidotransferase C subunit
MSSVFAEKAPLREDIPGETLPPEKLLKNSPDVEANQFRVPPVLDDSPHA